MPLMNPLGKAKVFSKTRKRS